MAQLLGKWILVLIAALTQCIQAIQITARFDGVAFDSNIHLIHQSHSAFDTTFL